MSNSEESFTTADGLSDLLRGAGIFTVGEMVGKMAGFVFNWLLTISLGATLFGIYAYSQLFISVANMFSDIGSKRALLRFLPEYEGDENQQREYVGFAFGIAILGGVIFGTGIFTIIPIVNKYTLKNPDLITVTRILALSLPFIALIQVVSHALRGIGRIDYQILIERVVYPIFRVGIVAIAVLIGASLINVSLSVVLAAIGGATIGMLLLIKKTHLQPRLSLTTDSALEFVGFSVPISLSNIEGVIYSNVDIFMIGLFLTSQDVGVYKIASLLGALLVLPLAAMNQLFAPLASNLITKGAKDELASIYQTTTRWILSVVLLMAMGLTIYRREMLGLFGPEFVSGQEVLVLILGGYLVNAAVGPTNWILTMADRQYLVMGNNWISGIINIVLNYFLIQQFGLIGAAVATASSLALLNLVRLIEVRTLEGYQPYTSHYHKPIIAGAAATGVMSLTHQILSGISVLVVGSTLGVIIYLLGLYLLGIEEQDKRVWAKILKQRRVE